MESIKFDTGGVIFRDIGEHDFAVGEDGVVSVVQREYLPYHFVPSCRSPIIKNLTGRFANYLEGYVAHVPVSKRCRGSFGRHDDMYHLHGSLSVHCGVPYFKGCAGLPSLKAIAEDLFLENPRCEVHMGVFKVCIGRRVDTSESCFLEVCVASRFKCLRVRRRIAETTQCVKLRVDNFDEAELPYLTGDLVPRSLDVSVSSRGVVILRFSWSKVVWSEDREASVLRFCGWVRDRLRECC